MRIKNIIDVRMSPDGTAVAWVQAEADFQSSSYHFTLWLSGIAGDQPRQIGPGRADVLPRWSPDGKQIAFLSKSPKAARLCLLNVGTATTRQIALPDGVKEIAWAPDGSALAFLAPGQVPAEERTSSTPVDIRIVGQWPPGSQLFLLDAESGRYEQLTSGDGHLVHFSWSPDGRQIAFARQASPQENDWLDTAVSIVNLETKRTRPLFEQGGVHTLPRWSPDGKWIAYVSQEGDSRWLGKFVLSIVPAEGGTPTVVSRNFDDCIWNSAPDSFFWAEDSRRIYFTADQKMTRQLLVLDTRTFEVRPITTGAYLHQLFSLSAGGDRMAFVIDRPSLPGEIHTSGTDHYRPKRLHSLNPHLDGLSFGESSVVRRTSSDGWEIEGLLIKPVGYEPGRRYPLVIYLHGGPGGAFQQGFSPQVRQAAQMEYCPIQVLAGRGYAVFCPNPRGSDGYGQPFREAVRLSWGEGDLDDVLSGIDHLIDLGVADPDRLGLIGYCYGGYLALCALIRTQRFKAATVGAGFADLYSLYGQSDLPGLFVDYFGDVPWKARSRYQKHSPIFAAHDIVTPVLFQHAENDRRIPWTQSLQVYNVLKATGVPTEFILYPRQEHLITDPRMNAESMRRNVLWLERWLKGGTGTSEQDVENLR
jgi:dipeptidyl aminopeptidase/acylaminoacyl peptidase